MAFTNGGFYGEGYVACLSCATLHLPVRYTCRSCGAKLPKKSATKKTKRFYQRFQSVVDKCQP